MEMAQSKPERKLAKTNDDLIDPDFPDDYAEIEPEDPYSDVAEALQLNGSELDLLSLAGGNLPPARIAEMILRRLDGEAQAIALGIEGESEMLFDIRNGGVSAETYATVAELVRARIRYQTFGRKAE